MAEDLNWSVLTRVEQQMNIDIDWLNNDASPEQKDKLKTFLFNLDKSNRVDMDNGRNKNVTHGVNEIMQMISHKMAERNSSFCGKLVATGSAHNGTKIGKPDESDFVYEMDGINILNRMGHFGRFIGPFDDADEIAIKSEDDKTSFIFQKPLEEMNGVMVALDTREHILVLDESSGSCLHRVSRQPQDLQKLESIAHRNPDGCRFISVWRIQRMFRCILKEVLSELKLPSGWRHSGFYTPNFSGLRESKLSYILQFDYLEKHEEDHLKVSIDLVPMLKVHENLKHGFLHDVLKDFTRTDNMLLSLQNCMPFFGHGEEEWLAQYSADSMSKTLIRTGKALNSLVRVTSPKFLPHYHAKLMVNIINQKTQGHTINTADLPDLVIPSLWFHVFKQDDFDDYASYSDLCENAGNVSMVNSHDIKNLVMTMMAVDESQGQNWTEDDLPDLVMSFYMLIIETNKRLLPNSGGLFTGFPIPVEELAKQEFSVSLNNIMLPATASTGSVASHQTRELTSEGMLPAKTSKRSPPESGKGSSKVRLDASKFVSSYQTAVTAMQLNITNFNLIKLGGIAAIFRLFRCVCEGNESADLKVYTIPDYRKPDVVTKRQLQEMLQNARIQTQQ